MNDLTGTLTNSEADILTNQIKVLTQKNHVQLVVLVADITGDETIEQCATRVLDSWKPGDKDRDDDILLLAIRQDHTVRIETGYELEGVVTGIRSRKIIHDSIIPAPKKGDLAGGLQKGTSDTENRLMGNNSVTIIPTDHPLFFSGWQTLLIWAIILAFISAREYIKTLGVTCFAAVVLTFVLPIAGFSGGWRVLTTLLYFVIPFLAVAIAFTPFGKKVRDSMRDVNQSSCHTKSNSSSHYLPSSSSSLDNDSFSGGGGSSSGGGASGCW